jgi:hypothetical protein
MYVIFTLRGENNILGLSPAGDLQFFVYRFFAPQGEKTIHFNDTVPCCRRQKCLERKTYIHKNIKYNAAVRPELDEGQAKAAFASQDILSEQIISIRNHHQGELYANRSICIYTR